MMQLKNFIVVFLLFNYALHSQTSNDGDKRILSNVIGNDQILIYGETPKPFSYYIPYYRDLNNLPGRRGSSTPNDIYLTNFKWQIKTQSSDWTDIPGETSPGYSPNKAIYENSSYRRLAFYEGTYDISNTIFIIINNQSFENTICCNQTLTSSSDEFEEIVGNVPNLTNFTYLWQTCSQPNDINKNWADMPFITDKNFPRSSYIPTYQRGYEITAYRRLIKQNGIVISISNSVNKTWPRPNSDTTEPTRNDGTTPTRRSSLTTNRDVETNFSVLTTDSNNINIKENLDVQNIENKTEQNSLKIDDNISLYPNPIIDNLFITGTVNIDLIYMYDSFGSKLNIEKHQKSTNQIEINTSKLQQGIYFLKIDNTTYSKTLIKN